MKANSKFFGPNISLGYIGDKNQTERSFIFHQKYKNKIIGYKTGDIVKKTGFQKELYFIGRKDTQIKLMGYRIELNEIELAINEIKHVNEAIVF